MAYVQPTGIIELYRNVPLTPSYNHTIYFPTLSAQRTYFTAHRAAQFTNQMYTRVHKNKVRVNSKYDAIAGCSYMGFNNERIDKWYYAFIDEIDYINEQVVEITFILDDIQSWVRNIVWNNCFIERQHSTTDEVGDNLQPEPIECNEHIATSTRWHQSYSSIGYILAMGAFTKPNTFASTNPFYTQNTYQGFASSVKYIYFSSASDLQSLLNKCEFGDGLLKGVMHDNDMWVPLALYAVPHELFQTSGQSASLANIALSVTLLSSSIFAFGITVTRLDKHGFGNTASNLYEPKNKKLLTYPYMYLSVETPTAKQDFKYETFLTGDVKFKYYSTCNPSPALVIMPEKYNGMDNDYQYAVMVDNFPELPIYQSGFYSGAAQTITRGVKLAAFAGITALTGGVSGIAKFAKAGSASTALTRTIAEKAGIENAGLIANYAKELPDVSTQSDIKGSGSSNLAPIIVPKSSLSSITASVFDIDVVQYGLRKEYAQKIDEFFHKYGYAQNKVGKPIIYARQNWTYIKTRDCQVGGDIPAEAMRTINRVMDEGITWWANTGNIGNYTDSSGNLLNNPIGVG